MNKNPVDDLYQEVASVIAEMKRNGDAPPVRIKSCLEHLRSGLEYLANDIYDKLTNIPENQRKDIYFPYGKPVFIEKYLSRLSTSHETIQILREFLTSIQPYHTGEEWLVMMCNLTNDAKHRRPIPLDKEEVITSQTISAGGVNLIHIAGAGTGRVQFEGCFVNGRPLQDFVYDNGKITSSGIGIPASLNITKEKKIRFHGHDYEVIPFLEKCFNELQIFIKKGYSILRDLT